ncbi:MAG: bifunctional 5,10-methylenetetrahydrofolate dehydrogenase/5,10-methenyltetrahydrofolate cyclohydrolase [Firmicutes bacterium]|nr:bifunctional 5,10-methylenetetrahydrofolate dehydrogenase/5,10-methenyltetrahydrofolate cyclohydrolase [Bacillota bacterium]
MANLLKGKAVADSLTEENIAKVKELKDKGVTPTLAIVRVGENPSDLSYERGAKKRAEKTGVTVKSFVYDENISQKKLLKEIGKINKDESIHGVLLFRPLPGHLDDRAVCNALAPSKDVDGITSGSLAGVFEKSGEGFPPCTAQACMEILNFIGYDLTGKKVTVMGRSLVIGKPVAMMAMNKNATVTVLHSKTTEEDFIKAGQNADVIISALGRGHMIGKKYVGRNQIIIDVGISVDDVGKIIGDVDFDEVEKEAEAITPVPGGVGSVTTAVLMKHVIGAAMRIADDAMWE